MHWHGTIAGDGRRALFPSDEDRLRAARALARVGGPAQCLFCAVDDHAHVVVQADARGAAQLAGSLLQALRRVAAAPLDPARMRPVESRRHLESLVRYVLDQTTHHALTTAAHPALWAGSCFPDLVGARLLPGFSPNALREALPRLTSEAVWGSVGLRQLEPASDEVLSGLGVDALIEAARRAAGLVDLRGNRPDAVRARAVAAGLARRIGVPARRAMEALGVAPRSYFRAASIPRDPALERAVRMDVALHAACADHGSGARSRHDR